MEYIYDDIKNPEKIALMRRDLTKLARGIRVSTIPEDANLSAPQSARDDQVLLGDKMVRRRRIVLLTPMCSAATCLMCPLPNEALDSKRRPITPEEISAQFDSVMEDGQDADFELLTLYTNGNFFADAEVPPVSRKHMYKLFKESKAEFLLVESLPQFLSKEKMEEAKNIIGDKKLIVAIGLQSASDLTRAISVNTTTTRESFERAYALLKEFDFMIQAFLMIKPPFLTDDEAIEDTVKSIQYLHELGIQNPILCATRVAPNTVLELLSKEGKFRTPWLWTVIEILKRSAQVSPNAFPRVVISELRKEGNADSEVPKNCDVCSTETVDAIEKYNEDRNIGNLSKLTHDCKDTYLKEKEEENRTIGKIPLEERVAEFLTKHKLPERTI